MSMAAAVYEALQKDPTLSNAGCMKVVQKKHPDMAINTKSFGVACSAQRKKLGITAPGANPPKAAPATANTIDLDAVRAAKALVAICGSAEAASAALATLSDLQCPD